MNSKTELPHQHHPGWGGRSCRKSSQKCHLDSGIWQMMPHSLEDASHTVHQAGSAQGIAVSYSCREGWQERGSVPQRNLWVAQQGLKDRTEPSQQVPPWEGLQLSWGKVRRRQALFWGKLNWQEACLEHTYVHKALPFESSQSALRFFYFNFLPTGTNMNSYTVGWHQTSELLSPLEGLASCWTMRTADCHFSMQILPSTCTHSTHTSSIMFTPALLWKHPVSYGYVLELQYPHGLPSHNLRSTATIPTFNLQWAMSSSSTNCSITLPINQLCPKKEQSNPNPHQLPGLSPYNLSSWAGS